MLGFQSNLEKACAVHLCISFVQEIFGILHFSFSCDFCSKHTVGQAIVMLLSLSLSLSQMHILCHVAFSLYINSVTKI